MTVLQCQLRSSWPYFFFISVFLRLIPILRLSVSRGVGVNGTAFPVGTLKSLTGGSNQAQTSKWRVSSSSLPIRRGACEQWLVWSHPRHHIWAGVPCREPTRRSWKGWDNETLWGQQRHLPLLSVTLQACMWNSQHQIQCSESVRHIYQRLLDWKSGIFYILLFWKITFSNRSFFSWMVCVILCRIRKGNEKQFLKF